MPELNIIQTIAVVALPLLFAITVHEAAHGWMAARCGDDTATVLGRVTLNPIPHIDPVGTILLPLGLYLTTGFVIGWAKPVPVNFARLRNPRKDMAFVALAGPGSNIIMMLAWTALLKIVSLTGGAVSWVAVPLSYMALAGVLINAILATLNLLPILPLDGGRILAALLPPDLSEAFSRLEPYGMIVLIILLVAGVLGPVLMFGVSLLQFVSFTIFGIG